MFPQSAPRFLNAVCQRLLLIEAGDDHGYFDTLKLAFGLHDFSAC
jgi:hypothetical protein